MCAGFLLAACDAAADCAGWTQNVTWRDWIRVLRDRWVFDLWYLFGPPWDSGVSPPELLEFLQTHPAGRAIDLGCGTGTNVIALARAGWRAQGIDFSPRAIRIAQRKLRRAGIAAEVVVGDVTRMSGINGPFDLALDIGCFHSLSSRFAYLRNLARILAPGGHWLLYGFLAGRASPTGRGLDSNDFEQIEKAGLSLLSRRDGADRGLQPSAWFLYQRLPNS